MRVQDLSPPPTTYNLKSDFKKQPSSKAYSFGISREAYENVSGSHIDIKVYLKEHPARDKNIPGPGTYKPPTCMGQEGSKYSLRPRTSNPSKYEELISQVF